MLWVLSNYFSFYIFELLYLKIKEKQKYVDKTEYYDGGWFFAS